MLKRYDLSMMADMTHFSGLVRCSAQDVCSLLSVMHVFEMMKAASSAWFSREEGLRREIARLEDRIHDLEEEKGELVASTSDNTRPLIRSATVYLPNFHLCSNFLT